jgi:hypothetical protein
VQVLLEDLGGQVFSQLDVPEYHLLGLEETLAFPRAEYLPADFISLMDHFLQVLSLPLFLCEFPLPGTFRVAGQFGEHVLAVMPFLQLRGPVVSGILVLELVGIGVSEVGAGMAAVAGVSHLALDEVGEHRPGEGPHFRAGA